jgi:hypothetical protein
VERRQRRGGRAGKELVDACSAAATRGTDIGGGGEDGHCELVGGRWGCHDGKIELDAKAGGCCVQVAYNKLQQRGPVRRPCGSE